MELHSLNYLTFVSAELSSEETNSEMKSRLAVLETFLEPADAYQDKGLDEVGSSLLILANPHPDMLFQ